MDISALLVLLGATLFTNEKSCEEIWKNEEDINICKEIAQLLQEINKKKFQDLLEIIKERIKQDDQIALQKVLDELKIVLEDIQNKERNVLEQQIESEYEMEIK